MGISSERTIGKPCPPLTEYTKDEQAKAASELAVIEEQFRPCALCSMMDHYSLLRDQCR